MNFPFKKIIFAAIFIQFLLFSGCGESEDENVFSVKEETGVAYLPGKDTEIQRYKIEQRKKLTDKRYSCDTLALMEFVLNNYPAGTYLVDFDKTDTFSLPKPAIMYYDKSHRYVFGVIAKSREGERLIETKNIVGYDQSFIDLDSTELGTAFFYLTLFKCLNNSFQIVWEALIPSHGGFNRMEIKKWKYNNTPFIRVNFHYARGIGHIDYNYFLINGLTNQPHLLMTYEGINFKRTIANVNNDKYPDYYEYIYYDLNDRIFAEDSVAFVWNLKDSVYVNIRNSRQTRRY